MPAGRKSTSSDAFCPTSPIHRSPVSRSNENCHGLRDAVGPDLRTALAVSERVVVGDRVGAAARGRRVDAEDLAEQRVGRLAVPAVGVSLALVAGAAAVAEPDVEVAVGAERQLPAVVVGLQALDREDLAARRRIDRVAVDLVLVDLVVAVRVRVVDVDAVAVGRERDPEQALFPRST